MQVHRKATPAEVFAAAAAGRAGALHTLLSEADEPVALTGPRQEEGGLTPLHAAAFAGSTTCAQLLVGARADVNAVAGSPGASPLCIAAAVGASDCLSSLLAMGAAVNLPDESGSTPLHASCATGQTECARLLIRAGADPAVADAAGATPLYVLRVSECLRPLR